MAENKGYPHNNPEWNGYTLDELRYQKALSAARLELQKERMMAQVQKMRETVSLVPSSGIIGRMFSSLNYVDYGLIAFRIIKRVTGLVRKFRHK